MMIKYRKYIKKNKRTFWELNLNICGMGFYIKTNNERIFLTIKERYFYAIKNGMEKVDFFLNLIFIEDNKKFKLPIYKSKRARLLSFWRYRLYGKILQSSIYKEGDITFCDQEEASFCLWYKKSGIIFVLDPQIINSQWLGYLSDLIILDALRKRGYIVLHASAVAMGKKGIIFPSYSGGGKSTLALFLLENGFNFLSDDTIILRKEKNKFYMYSLSKYLSLRKIDACRYSSRYKVALKKGKVKSNGYKIFFKANELYPNSILERASINLILFPYLDVSGKIKIKKSSVKYTFNKLLQHITFLGVSYRSKKESSILKALAKNISSYNLYIGKELEELPLKIQELIR